MPRSPRTPGPGLRRRRLSVGTPGPGRYHRVGRGREEIGRHGEGGPRFSFGGGDSRFRQLQTLGPGPALCNQHEDGALGSLRRHSSTKGTFGAAPPSHTATAARGTGGGSPGPAAYDQSSSRFCATVRQRAPAYTMRSPTRPRGDGYRAEVAAPLGRKAGRSFIGRSPMTAPPTPSPSQYEPVLDSTRPSGPKFTFGGGRLREEALAANARVLAGVGAVASPGPAQYQPEASRDSPAFSLGQRLGLGRRPQSAHSGEVDGRSGSPGPGRYTPRTAGEIGGAGSPQWTMPSRDAWISSAAAAAAAAAIFDTQHADETRQPPPIANAAAAQEQSAKVTTGAGLLRGHGVSARFLTRADCRPVRLTDRPAGVATRLR
jgi:hypothetical protein